jgi:WD40 repeat protein/serine/threonine protein kinase
MENLSGTLIKGYELQERIGTGGFGAVYRAYQSTVGREVAVKVILPGFANQPNFIRRFETEAQLVARLEHLHIVPLHDFWRDPEGAYLVMRLLRGGSLQDVLRQGAYDLETAALMLDQVASALSVAHRNKIIHRDIKPPNILLDEDGNSYLSDFGIAKEIGKTDSILTDPDALIGSPDYLAPEQARSEMVTPQTDIYSLGVVLYEALSGEHPFPGLSPVECLFKHLNEPIPMIAALDPEVTEAVNQVIQKATEKNPMNRFEDVVAMATAFREAAGLSVSKAVRSLVELLTPREQEVLKLLVEGRSNREIAEKLTLELTTIRWYLRQIYKKLNVRSRVQAIVRARELNLIVESGERSKATSGSIGLPEPENPYKGLRAFQVADEQDFFGRDRLIQKLLTKMESNGQHERFMAVVGPSGSGKSSLVKAGLIPALWRGALPGSEKWYIVEMMPSTKPLDELEIALTRISADQGINFGEQLQRDENGLLRSARMILPEDDSELLLVIDQFEEVFTLIEDEDLRSEFLNLLHCAVTDSRSRVRVVVTLRADFYDRPLHYPEFGELVRNRMETVLPLSVDELEQAILQPANRVGVKFEEGLAATIIQDVHYQPGALPLLQYALTELFEVRKNRNLTYEGYQEVGRAVGALAKRAEEVYAELDEKGGEEVQQMFLRLVTLGEGVEDTRRRVERTELLAIADNPDLMDEIIDTYANYRLLSLDNDLETRHPTVEIAHEALLREWERLGEWLNENRTDILFQRQLAHAAGDWDKSERDESYLLRGVRLDEFDAWREKTELNLTGVENAFLDASITAWDQEKAETAKRAAREAMLEKRTQTVLRWLVGVFLVAAVVSAWLAVSANRSGQEAQLNAYALATSVLIAEQSAEEEAVARATAEAAEYNALMAASIGFASQAELQMIGPNPERAVLLALEAIENYPYTWQAERALGQAVLNHNLIIEYKHGATLSNADISPDETRILTAGDGVVMIWDYLTGEVIHALDAQGDSGFLRGWWSPNGDRILTHGASTVTEVWDAATGDLLLSISEHEGYYADWSPDGSRIHTSYSFVQDNVMVWDAETGEKLLTLPGNLGLIKYAFWSPDGKNIATTNGKVWDAETGEELFSLPGFEDKIDNRLQLIAFYSQNGAFLAGGYQGGGPGIIWDANTGEQLNSFSGHSGSLHIFWSPQMDRILTVSADDGVAKIYDAQSGDDLFTLAGTSGFHGAWSPDGSRILTAGEEGDLIVWDAQTGKKLLVMKISTGEIGSFEWFSSGDRILSTDAFGSAKVWDVSQTAEKSIGCQPDCPFSYYGGWASAVGWSPSGEKIARGFMGGMIKIWEIASGQEVITMQYEPVSDDYASGGVQSVVWSPNGDYLLTSGNDGTTRVWDASSGEELFMLPGNPEESVDFDLYAVWSPDGSRILTASAKDGAAQVWDISNAFDAGTDGIEILQTFEEHIPFSASWSPDGTRIVTSDLASEFGSAKVWDAATGKVLLDLFPEDFGFGISGVAWSPDGSRIATFSGDGLGRIWDADIGEELQKFTAVSGVVGPYIEWSPSGERILTAGDVGEVKIWDAETGSELLNFPISGFTAFASWSPKGNSIAVGDYDGNLNFFPAWDTTDDLVEHAKECCIVRQLTPEERERFGLPLLED